MSLDPKPKTLHKPKTSRLNKISQVLPTASTRKTLKGLGFRVGLPLRSLT